MVTLQRASGGAGELFEAIDAQAAAVAAQLLAVATREPEALKLAESLRADLARHAAERDTLRRRLALSEASPSPEPEAEPDLGALRDAQEALVYTHAEGLPRLDDELAIDTLARHMVDLSRHLTVTELWLDKEAPRG